MNTVVGELQKNAVDKVRVSRGNYNGHDFIDIRVFFEDDTGEWKPTKKGVALSPDRLPELIGLLRKAQNGGK